MSKTPPRCPWVPADDPLYIAYHDEEWGIPLFNDNRIFEFLTLEAAQAGLSWRTVLRKRENYRKAFANFDPKKVAKFGDAQAALLLQNEGIIRNRAKIAAAINNAGRFLEVQKEFGTFAEYIWRFVNRKPIRHKLKTLKDYPTEISEARELSKDLKKRGFKFVGPTIIYAHMQAAGMVNDHTVDCFRYRKV